MIMAGRGRRLGDIADPTKKIGTPVTSACDERPVDFQMLIKSIEGINLSTISLAMLNIIKTQFIKLCTNSEALKNVVTDLYSKALSDETFINKLVVALVPVISFEIDGQMVRSVLLVLMQNEYSTRDTVLQTNKSQFYNATEFLSVYYYLTSNQGSKLWFLGEALISYMELLLKGGKNELKIFTKAISFTNVWLSKAQQISEKYKLLHSNLRSMLLDSATDNVSKCWILLAIELMASNGKPLPETSEDFYFKNLQNEYKDIISYIHFITTVNSKLLGPKNETSNITEKLIDMNLSSSPSDKPKDRRSNDLNDDNRNKRKDSQNWRSGKAASGKKSGHISKSGHDDRFHKDENFYGPQAQRLEKSDHIKNIQKEKEFKKACTKSGPNVHNESFSRTQNAGEKIEP